MKVKQQLIINYAIVKGRLVLKRFGKVYSEKPLCVIQENTHFKDPVLAPTNRGLPLVMERKAFEKKIEEAKVKAKASVKDGQRYVELALMPDGEHLVEVSPEHPNMVWFGVLTYDEYNKINRMRVSNGHIIYEPEHAKPEPQPEKAAEPNQDDKN